MSTRFIVSFSAMDDISDRQIESRFRENTPGNRTIRYIAERLYPDETFNDNTTFYGQESSTGYKSTDSLNTINNKYLKIEGAQRLNDIKQFLVDNEESSPTDNSMKIYIKFNTRPRRNLTTGSKKRKRKSKKQELHKKPKKPYKKKSTRNKKNKRKKTKKSSRS